MFDLHLYFNLARAARTRQTDGGKLSFARGTWRRGDGGGGGTTRLSLSCPPVVTVHSFPLVPACCRCRCSSILVRERPPLLVLSALVCERPCPRSFWPPSFALRLPLPAPSPPSSAVVWRSPTVARARPPPPRKARPPLFAPPTVVCARPPFWAGRTSCLCSPTVVCARPRRCFVLTHRRSPSSAIVCLRPPSFVFSRPHSCSTCPGLCSFAYATCVSNFIHILCLPVLFSTCMHGLTMSENNTNDSQFY